MNDLANDVILISSVLGALGVIAAFFAGPIRWFMQTLDTLKKMQTIVKTNQQELAILCFAMRACLNGFHDLGVEGEISVAIEKMDKHINEAAHDLGDMRA